MITKKEICDVLKDYIGNDVTILPNRIQNNKTKAICVEDSNLVQAKKFASNCNYNQQAFRLTIRYSNNETESEDYSRTLFETIKNIENVLISSKYKWHLTLKIEEPYATGTVKNDIYEQRLEFAIIYEIL